MLRHTQSEVSIRQIDLADIDAVSTLLGELFPNRTRKFWVTVLRRLEEHANPPGTPKFGYLIECENVPVGALLLISTMIEHRGVPFLRCNVSSWCVRPEFRSHAQWLSARAIRRKDATYFNLTPAPHTLAAIEAQGFLRFSSGQFVMTAFPSVRRGSVGVRVVGGADEPDAFFEPFERKLLASHARYGCMSFWCVTPERAYPFVFLPRIAKRVVPCVHLVYCREIEDLRRFAPQIGAYLCRRGRPFIIVDSNGTIPGLNGKYLDEIAPKYYKGATPPRIGDLAYTELAFLPRLYPAVPFKAAS